MRRIKIETGESKNRNIVSNAKIALARKLEADKLVEGSSFPSIAKTWCNNM